MSFVRRVISLRLASIALFITLLLAVLWRSSIALQQSEKRGILVADIVRQQIHFLSQEPLMDEEIVHYKHWPDEYRVLGRWLVLEVSSARRPRVICERLASIADGHEYSSALKASIGRWLHAFHRWDERDETRTDLSSGEILIEARQRYVEASGYQTIGMRFDGLALYLWAADLLQRYFEKTGIESPSDPKIPEALYLLGDIYISLKKYLPSDIRSDRILNLVSEFYPNTIWSEQADALWKSEIENGA